MDIVSTMLAKIDPRLYPVVVNLIIFGYWIKKRNEQKPLPKWFPKIPQMMILISFGLCTLFGWIFTDAEGFKAVVSAVLVYGLSNGFLCAVIAMGIYDNVHVYTKKLEKIEKKADLSVAAVYLAAGQTDKEKRMKALLYGGCAGAGALVAALFASLVGKMDWFLTIAWALFGAGLTATAARIIYHIVINDNAPETWQVSIYALVACLGWLLAIFSRTTGTDILAFAIMLGAAMMLYGTRFIRLPMTKDEIIEWLRSNVRYKFIEDNPLLGYDTSEPITKIANTGESLTVTEALSWNFIDAAAQGEAYLAQTFHLIQEEK